ncbi:asparagine synthase (glutamine-hydrolyzing) [Anoxybacteroides amylolyticum]|uniref:asparagine synthase (glutamine-hydrolyzing) n=1 Tax=Anoxybacteroides amylolyticum TaxID=294699 RepID=A0A160F6A4_9BACL|nr:asparagine synthase (glutamine-hydrolyzing) [Anoxybacillus amylolyticus]ANB61711.1 asparagine synthase [Anoxybacillus amylolyticus]
MCGIAAVFSNKQIPFATIKKMTDIIEHRGPDGEGHQSLLDDKLWLGHRRLAIVDLSNNGSQPMSYKNGRYWIVFNGEIYNYIEIRKELEALGHRFVSTTDTEVIMAAYDEWGEACLHKFNGMWAFIIIDTVAKTLFASRDRFGVKPFYYAVKDETIAFASEIKQLLVEDFVSKKANRDKVAKFLLFGEVNIEKETFFEGVNQLLPSEAMRVNLDEGVSSLKVWRYYHPPLNQSMKRDGNLVEYQQQFKELLFDSVRLRLRSDVPVGSCLSGGMDSSSIVLVMHELFKQNGVRNNIKTFTSCFANKKYDEWEFAETIVEQAEADSYRVYPDMNDLFHEIEDLIWHQDEPFKSTSIYAQWNVMRLARQNNITVLLDGQGADETMAGYHPYISVYMANLIRAGEFQTAAEELKKLKETGLISATEPLGKVWLKIIYHALGVKIRRGSDVKELLKKEYEHINRTEIPSNFQEYLYTEIFGSLQSLLRYEDRNSMAFSIEARTPYLDYRLVELMLSIPGGYKIYDGYTKPFLRQAMKGIMNDKVRLRVDKKGFVTPEDIWYREKFAEIKSILLSDDSPLDLWIDKTQLKNWLNDPVKPFGKYHLWRLLSVHFWMKKFNLG